MRIVVTGAGGRLGAPVCRQLMADGFDVLAVDRQYRRDLPGRFEVADLLQHDACYRLFEGRDVIIHLANLPAVESNAPQVVFIHNMTTNMNVFQAAADLGVRHVVFAGSIQVMDGAPGSDGKPLVPPYLPLDGEAPRHTDNLYGLSKALSEEVLEYLALRMGFAATILRLPGISFPKQLAEGNRAWFDRKKTARMRDAFALLHVEDAVTLMSAIAGAVPNAGARRYLPASPVDVAGLTITEIVKEFFPETPLRRPLEQMEQLVDPTPLERDFGWRGRTVIRLCERP